MTVREFSKKIQYTENYVSGVMNDTRTPGRKLREAIVAETNGEVTFDEGDEIKKV
jgi:hypothetical protein